MEACCPSLFPPPSWTSVDKAIAAEAWPRAWRRGETSELAPSGLVAAKSPFIHEVGYPHAVASLRFTRSDKPEFDPSSFGGWRVLFLCVCVCVDESQGRRCRCLLFRGFDVCWPGMINAAYASCSGPVGVKFCKLRASSWPVLSVSLFTLGGHAESTFWDLFEGQGSLVRHC